MRVTLDVFSGRPNPTWHLSGGQVGEFRDRYEPVLRAGAATVTPPPEPATLGFRGFTVSEDVPGELVPSPVPQQCWVAAPGAASGWDTSAQVAREEVDTADWLLTTAQSTVPDELAQVVHAQLGRMRRGGRRRASQLARNLSRDNPPGVEAIDISDRDAQLATATGAAACRPFLAPMRLAFWNTPYVQPYNNCYNYATNFVSGTRAQPGRRSGQIYSSFRGEDVLAAATRDGLELNCSGDVRVVALGVWPGLDFHWWRLHPDGFWAHKIGWWPAQDRDNSFRVIGAGLTPATCDRGLYSEFVGYYFIPLSTWVA